MIQDSILTSQPLRELPIIDDIIIDDVPSDTFRPLTPYQVLRMLPSDATPAQQDSAIQAWFQPGEIHYSEQPDTLHLPGHEPGRSLKEVNLPQYYRQNFFSNDPLFHPEIDGGRSGVAGDPIPYTIRCDNMFTSLLLLCIVLFFFSIARSKWFISRQLRDFFYLSYHDDMTETSGELRFQLFLVLLCCLLLAISSYLYVTAYVADTFQLDNDFQLISLFFGSFVGYFLLKSGLYSLVNYVFFDGNKSLQWMQSALFLTAMEGVLLFPAVLLQVYFDLSVQNVIFYYVFILLIIKILTFYRSWVIFFRQNGVYLQNILYFCALEIVPLLGFAGSLLSIVNLLKINF
jgi:hypothetical protein